MSKYIMAIDQGTTGSTVSIISSEGNFLASADEDFAQIYPQPGWVEHDANVIWQTVTSCIQKALIKGGINGNEIAAIGITNQRETVVLWDRKTHQPVHNAIVWQCRRTTDFCNKLKGKHAKTIYKKTGLVVDPYFSASKINWLLTHVKGARKAADKGELAVGTIDTFLIWRLTGGASHKTDVSNASRTQLMNLERVAWDEELLRMFSVPRAILPEISPSNALFGSTKGLGVLPDGIPIYGVAGDQQSALFGQACFDAGEAKCTYGTGSFILMNTGSKLVHSKSGLLTTVAWQLQGERKPTYALEGGAFICGAAVQWLRDEMKFFSGSAEIEKLAHEVNDTGGVEFIPALTGLGAPYWDPEARGTITGITRGTNRAHIARATLEAMALQNVDILEAMEKDLGKRLKTLKVDGGASANNLLMQMQSDYLGIKICRPKVIETTSMGAAFLAGLGAGIWSSVGALKKVWQFDSEWEPKLKPTQKRERMDSWRSAVSKTMYHGGLKGLK